MNQTEQIHIIIDHRENKLKALLDKKKDKITYESKQLDIADIVISSEVAIERKEGFDFVSSIMDNRLFEQLLRLKDTYTYPILILEGLNDKVFENTKKYCIVHRTLADNVKIALDFGFIE